MEKSFKKIKLDNGLRVILVPRPNSLATTVLVLVEAGSKYETKNINGLSHFLEHMCFRGTKRRPTELQISSELDSLGASYNAFTSQEYTGYFAKVRNKKFEQVLDIVSDVYLNPTLAPGEIDKERGPIIEEINMYEDLPMRRVQDLFLELVYGDQPAGWNILGTKDNIRRLTKENFLRYRDEHYVAKATIVVVAGGFDEKGVEEKVKNAFSGIHDGKKSSKISVQEKQRNPRYTVSHKTSDQTHLVMGFRAFDVHDPRRYALDVLADMLGGGISSRLFQRIRAELGAAYYVNASADLYTDHGLFVMSAGVDHQKLDVVVNATLEEFAKLKEKKVGSKELQKVKDHMIGHLFLSLETSDELGLFYGIQEVMGMPCTAPRELAKKIESVTPEEVQSVARDVYANNRLNLAVIGPFKEKSFSDILKI